MSAPQEPETSKRPSPPVGSTGLFQSVFLVWCFIIFVGAAFSGRASAAYGALTPGAMFGVVAFVSGMVAILLVVAKLRDWRPWVALGLCLLAVLLTVAHTAHGGGP